MLAESGAQALSIADVAARAGVHETSIYRRWGTPQRLILDALLHRSADLIQIPDTGSLRTDLVELGQSLIAYSTSPVGQALSRMMASSDDDDELSATRREFWDERQHEAHTIVEKAIARGELPDNTTSRHVVEVFISPIHFRLLLTRQPIDNEFLTELAEIAISGVRGHE